MTRDEIKQVITDKFKQEFDIDISNLDGDFVLIDIEEHFNVEVSTVESQINTIDDLVNFIFKYVSAK